MRSRWVAATMLGAVLASAEPPGTRLFDLDGVAKALQVASGILGGGRWTAREGSIAQRRLLARLATVQADLVRVPEVSGFAAPTAELLNQALRRAGFDLRLPTWPSDGKHFGVAALLKVRFQWQEPGAVSGDQVAFGSASERASKVFTVAGNHPAFLLESEVSFGELEGAREPVVILLTRSEDRVYLWRTDEAPRDGLALFDLAARIARTEAKPCLQGYAGVYVPMVNANLSVDLSWMEGMRLNRWWLARAAQQVKFKMNHFGAAVESATALQMTMGTCGPFPPKHYKIDGPFMAVITRRGVKTPIFAGYIGVDSFGDPGLR